ncbi:hypothetical protein GCM10009740_16780 [Terrabacter terrae]|uniref:Uncharacterized protein n=1 Tax=Terrabacter terrae TaxID=318434 RepID=A0ABN2U4L0_9MICO
MVGGGSGRSVWRGSGREEREALRGAALPHYAGLVHCDSQEEGAPKPQPRIADDGERSAARTRERADHHIGKKVTPAGPPNLGCV